MVDPLPKSLPEQSMEEYISGSLPRDLNYFRAAFLGIARRSPDELQDLLHNLRESDPQAATSVVEAFRQIQVASENLLPLIQKSDLLNEIVETCRKPLRGEPQKITPDKVLVLVKRSRVEIDRRPDESLDDLYQRYFAEGSNAEAIFESHRAQEEAKQELSLLVPRDQWHYFFDLNSQEKISLIQNSAAELIISLGGDDTAKAIAPYITDKFLAVFNSDHLRSKGVNTAHTKESFESACSAYFNGNFLVEEWARLAVTITYPNANGSDKIVETFPAINEVAILDQNGLLMGRGSLYQDGKELTPMKATGLLLAVGAGSTGWYNSATEALYPLGRRWPRTAQRAEFIMRERYRYGMDLETLLNPDPSKVATFPGVLLGGESLEFISSSNNSQILTIDCTQNYELPRGAKASIRLAENGLKFMRAQIT